MGDPKDPNGTHENEVLDGFKSVSLECFHRFN